MHGLQWDYSFPWSPHGELVGLIEGNKLDQKFAEWTTSKNLQRCVCFMFRQPYQSNKLAGADSLVRQIGRHLYSQRADQSRPWPSPEATENQKARRGCSYMGASSTVGVVRTAEVCLGFMNLKWECQGMMKLIESALPPSHPIQSGGPLLKRSRVWFHTLALLRGWRCRVAAPLKRNYKKKKKAFVDTIIPKVLRDFRFNVNQLPKSADDWYDGVLKYITKTYECVDIFFFKF